MRSSDAHGDMPPRWRERSHRRHMYWLEIAFPLRRLRAAVRPLLTMDANKSVKANFIAGVNITVSKQGEGTVTPESGVYPKDVPKTFIATPVVGWRWSHWEGTLGGNSTNASLTLPMTTAGSIKAVFIERATLTIIKSLTGNLPAEGGSVRPPWGSTSMPTTKTK